MKTSTAKKIAVFKRLTQSKLVTELKTLNNDFDSDRQNILTELMLLDIDNNDHTVNADASINSECFYRVTDAGTFVIAKGGKPQLAKCARDRLNEITTDAYSVNDFRRCYDFIKSKGKWIDEKESRSFEVDTDAVNNSMRGGGRWPNFNKKPSDNETADTLNNPAAPAKPTAEKAIIGMAGCKEPEIVLNTKTKTPRFKAPSKASTYYTRIIQKLMNDVRKGGMTIEVKLDGENIALTGDA